MNAQVRTVSQLRGCASTSANLLGICAVSKGSGSSSYAICIGAVVMGFWTRQLVQARNSIVRTCKLVT